ncbi:hypothetical protein NMY22_g6185 [Coprinellus aureogranulatus]|nr:hypothetical protein NMY22_g6185 [Coprinellus aureogranulatus]
MPSESSTTPSSISQPQHWNLIMNPTEAGPPRIGGLASWTSMSKDADAASKGLVRPDPPPTHVRVELSPSVVSNSPNRESQFLQNCQFSRFHPSPTPSQYLDLLLRMGRLYDNGLTEREFLRIWRQCAQFPSDRMRLEFRSRFDYRLAIKICLRKDREIPSRRPKLKGNSYKGRRWFAFENKSIAIPTSSVMDSPAKSNAGTPSPVHALRPLVRTKCVGKGPGPNPLYAGLRDYDALGAPSGLTPQSHATPPQFLHQFVSERILGSESPRPQQRSPYHGSPAPASVHSSWTTRQHELPGEDVTIATAPVSPASVHELELRCRSQTAQQVQGHPDREGLPSGVIQSPDATVETHELQSPILCADPSWLFDGISDAPTDDFEDNEITFQGQSLNRAFYKRARVAMFKPEEPRLSTLDMLLDITSLQGTGVSVRHFGQLFSKCRECQCYSVKEYEGRHLCGGPLVPSHFDASNTGGGLPGVAMVDAFTEPLSGGLPQAGLEEVFVQCRACKKVLMDYYSYRHPGVCVAVTESGQ